MNCCKGFFLTLKTHLVVCLSALSLTCMASTGGVQPSPVTVESLVFTCTPITGPLGNTVGVTIPLKRAGRLFLIEATLDHVTGNFILDTGASGLVLNKTYFRNSIPVDNEEGGGVTGSTGQVSRTTVKHLQVADLSYQNIAADVMPLGHLENRRGVKILGLFGMSMLLNMEMVIDLRNNELQLLRLDKSGNTVEPGFPKIKFDILQKIDEYGNIMFVRASIGGKLLGFCLDTGAESNVMSIDLPKKALSTITITRRSSLNGVGSDENEVLYGTLNDFLMGTRQIATMETILCSLSDMARQYGYPIDGMLGYDFFSKGKIYINLIKKEIGICLKPEGKS